MITTKIVRNLHQEGDAVATTTANDARVYAQSLIRLERSRGSKEEPARRDIARRLRVGVGTFSNIVKDRVKRVDSRIRDRIHALLIRELESEIKRLTHELEIVRRSGVSLGSDQVREIEAHLAAVRSLIGVPTAP
jgi:hypothetical protein